MAFWIMKEMEYRAVLRFCALVAAVTRETGRVLFLGVPGQICYTEKNR